MSLCVINSIVTFTSVFNLLYTNDIMITLGVRATRMVVNNDKLILHRVLSSSDKAIQQKLGKDHCRTTASNRK